MSNKDKKDLVVFADLEVKLKEFMTELDSLDDDTDYRDLNQFFKVLAFKLSLKRLFIIIKTLKKIEERLEVEVDVIEDIGELMNVYKSLVKGMDLLNSQLRFFFPSKLSKEYNEQLQEVDSVLSGLIDEEGNVNTKNIVIYNIRDILKSIVRIKKDMSLFDSGSVDYWKAQNSYLELLNKLMELVKTLEKIKEQENSNEVELTIDEILEAYNEIKEFEEEELSEIEEKWKKQKSDIKKG
jgi:hypothetical protein